MVFPTMNRLAVLSIFGYLAMVGGLLTLILGRSLFSASPPIIALQVLALVLMLWARISFGRRSFHLASNPTRGPLVTTGPYRCIRHPIYTAVCLFSLPSAAYHCSLLAGVGAVAILAGALVRIFCEESVLGATYPEYSEYRKRTSRMVPWLF
jgi:protein-S-isoprenylcysteine O-methyltransferase Ste14